MSLPQIIDAVQNFAPAVSVLGATIVSFVLLFQKRREGYLRNKKSELEVIHFLVEPLVKDDPHYKAYSDDIRKEEHSQFLYGRAIPNSKLGPLMEFHRKGSATIKEIAAAWSFHQIEDGKLLFRISAWHKIGIILITLYVVVCILMAAIMALAAIYAHKTPQDVGGYVISAIMLVAMTIVVHWTNAGMYAALRLSKIS